MFEDMADASYFRDTRLGRMETQIFMQPHLPDGRVYWMGMRWVHIGTAPLSLMEEVGREARLIVRRGMQDVLRQLGQTWYNEPTGKEILDAIRCDGDTSLLEKARFQGAHQ